MGTPLTALKGVGDKTSALFEKLGIMDVAELLLFAPRQYLDYSECIFIANAKHDENCAIRATVASSPRAIRKGQLSMLVMTVVDALGARMQLTWFNAPYLKNGLKVGDERVFCGITRNERGVRMINPLIFEEAPGILPVYPLVKGLSQGAVRSAVTKALDITDINAIEDRIPKGIAVKYALPSHAEAIRDLHHPCDMEAAAKARARFAFEEMLTYTLAVSMLKRARDDKAGIAFNTEGALEFLKAKLPFNLTNGQEKVCAEIAEDMGSKRAMNRLLQGDVGSGKTAMALYASAIAVQNGYQAIIMAPTEILARQHYSSACKVFGEGNVCLLRGGMKKKERDEALSKIASGDARVITGTHALFQDGVEFAKPGLVVTDEQHRFGVKQRAAIANKSDGTAVDVLVMSATPIPRTLALLLYGDLDASILSELPPGRKAVKTHVVPPSKRDGMYEFMAGHVAEGEQAYVVCPLVEESENVDAKDAQTLCDELKREYPAVKFDLLHGRMRADKKAETVDNFVSAKTDVLVSTTVVEVGVDVPNASVMIIENAERFGLAQLHQLRGRVGRGSAQAYCFLHSQSDKPNERLKVLAKSGDGFFIAEEDLKMRGPGEFFGTRQNGLESFSVLALSYGIEPLLNARQAAEELISQGENEESKAIFEQSRRMYEEKMRDIAVN